MTPWTIAHQATPSVDSPGKNTGVSSYSLLQASSWPRDWTHCTAGRLITMWVTREAFFLVVFWSLSYVRLFAMPCTAVCRLPCPSPSPGACSNSHPLSHWCITTILSSVVPFSSCLQSFPASGSFLMSRITISPFSIWSGLISFRIDWFDLLAIQGTLKSLLQHHNSKASILWCWP